MSLPWRVYVACDVSNIWRSCRDQFGNKARVNFELLSSVIPSIFEDVDVDVNLVAYLVADPLNRHHSFEKILSDIGYEVRHRFLKHRNGRTLNTAWDVGITIDALSRADEYDAYVLVSGDGDFSMLLDHLSEEMEKETVVLSFRNSCAKSLAAADLVYHLNSNIIFEQG
jgi:uncharacterized LabA/DUF88 family protein